MGMTAEAAAETGAQALVFLAERPDDVAAFLAETGADPSDLRAMAEDPAALGFVLAFVARDEERAEAFCRDAALTAEDFAAARATLLGADTHWT